VHPNPDPNTLVRLSSYDVTCYSGASRDNSKSIACDMILNLCSLQFANASGRWLRAKLNHETSDSHFSKPQCASLQFKLEHLPDLPPELLASMMPAHLFLTRYRAHDPSARRPKRQETTPTLRPCSILLMCYLVLLHDPSTLGKLHLRIRH
jgi:hypothetical protein